MTLGTKALGLSGLLLTALTGLLIEPGIAAAETNPPTSSTVADQTAEQEVAQINVQVNSPAVDVPVKPALATPALPSLKPEAEVDLGGAQVRFPLRNRNTVTAPATSNTQAPQVAAPQAVPQETAPKATAQPSQALPSSPSPRQSLPIAQPTIPAPTQTASYPPAVINLTTIQPAGYGAQNAGYAGTATAPSVMPSNFQLVCSPTAGRSVIAGNGAVNNAVAGQTAGQVGSNPAGVAQQAVGSVLGGARNAGARRPGLLRSLIPNPSMDVDLGPVSVAVPIPISAIPALFQGRNGNSGTANSQTTNPQTTPTVAPGQPNGSAITAAAPIAAANPQATNTAIAQQANNYPMPYGVGGPETGGLTQIVTSQHTIINLTTVQSVPATASNTQNASYRSVASQPTTMQASTVQLVCNP